MTDIIVGFFTDLLTSAFEIFDVQITKMLSSILYIENMLGGVFSADMIANVYDWVYYFGIALVILKFLFKGFEIYILWRDGDADCSPQDMLMGAVEAATVMVCFPYLYKIMADVTLWFASGIMQRFTLTEDYGIKQLVRTLAGLGLFELLVLIVYVVMAIVLYLKLLGRGVELLIMRIALPIGCLGLIDSDMGIFKAFMQTFYKTMFTSVIQIVLFCFSFRLAISATFTSLLLAIVFAMTAFAVPTLMQSLLIPMRQGSPISSKVYQGAQLTRMATSFLRK